MLWKKKTGNIYWDYAENHKVDKPATLSVHHMLMPFIILRDEQETPYSSDVRDQQHGKVNRCKSNINFIR